MKLNEQVSYLAQQFIMARLDDIVFRAFNVDFADVDALTSEILIAKELQGCSLYGNMRRCRFGRIVAQTVPGAASGRLQENLGLRLCSTNRGIASCRGNS